MSDKNFMVDCVFTAGELDESGHRFKDNDLKVFEIAKHNVPYSEFQNWKLSPEFWKRKQELEQIGRDRFGKDYWMKYQVCYFCTSPSKD